MAALGILTVSVYDGALKAMKVREPAKDANCRQEREATLSHHRGHEMRKKKSIVCFGALMVYIIQRQSHAPSGKGGGGGWKRKRISGEDGKTSCIITCPFFCIFNRQPPLTVACRGLAVHDKVLEGRRARLKHDHLHSKSRHGAIREKEKQEGQI
jgi:hypothetical protein